MGRTGQTASGQEGAGKQGQAFGVPGLSYPSQGPDVDRAAHDELDGCHAAEPGAAGQAGQPGRIQPVVLGISLVVVGPGRVEGPGQYLREVPTGKLCRGCRWAVYH